MKTIVIAGDMLDEGFTSLYETFKVIKPPKGRNFSQEELLNLIPSADGVLSFFSAKFDREMIDKGKKLKIISNFGVGYDNIDIDYAGEKGIVVTNTPDPVTIPTAELTIGLMFSVARKIAFLDRTLRNQSDYKWGILTNMGVTLKGKTLGIFGMGRIGSEIARIASALGMQIIYHNRQRSDNEQTLNAQFVSFETLLDKSDFLSINAPSSDETRNTITLTALKKMKPDAILINTARGDIINETDLVFALQNNIIAGAALDVYENGDSNISTALFELDNVVLTPHIGTQTVNTRIEMGRYASQNIIRFFNGEAPLSRIK